MAFERSKISNATGAVVRRESIDVFIESLLRTFRNQLNIRNAADESRFNEQVVAGNMTLANQLEYRKAQLKRVSDDPEERLRIKAEVSNLVDQIEQQAFTDAWMNKLADFQGGLISVDSVISFLNETRANTQDQAILNDISSRLAEMQAQKFTLTQDMIRNSTQYAVNSKAVSIINDQIDKVQGYRNNAEQTGNSQLVSMYNLQLQSLRNAKNEAEIKNQILDLGVSTAAGSYGAIDMLNALNQRINDSNEEGSVTISGVTYASAKDFWINRRTGYLSDSSTSGFFEELARDVSNDLSTKQSKNALSTRDLRRIGSEYDRLSTRGELDPYQTQLDVFRQDSIQKGADRLMEAVDNEFTRTLDVGKAVASLNAIKSFGVNVDEAFTKILKSNAAIKDAQVQNILNTANELMKNNPGLGAEEAVQQAIQAGSGFTTSPEDAAFQTEEQLASQAVGTAASGTGVVDPRTTATRGAPAPGVSSGDVEQGQDVGGGIILFDRFHQGRDAGAGNIFITKDGTLLRRPVDNPTPELDAARRQQEGGGGTGSIQVFGRFHEGRDAGPGNVFIIKDGTLLRRPENNPTPELDGGGGGQQQQQPQTQQQGGGDGGGGDGGGGQQGGGFDRSRIQVFGRLHEGRDAGEGNIFIVKDGTLLRRPADNPTPEFN